MTSGEWLVASETKLVNRLKSANAKPKHYKDLLIWQKAVELAKAVYKLTEEFPDTERFGLVAQMRRAAVSVASNIAEGQARYGTREFLQFLSHSSGSLAELETQLIISQGLGFGSKDKAVVVSDGIGELQRMMAGMRRSLLASH